MTSAQRAEGAGHAVVIDGRKRFLARNQDGSFGPSYTDEPVATKAVPVSVRATPPKSIEAQGATIVSAIKGYVAREIAAALEAQQRTTPADFFRGPWIAGQSYARGDLTQRSGALWLALEDSSEMPGSSPSWRKLT